MRFEIAQTRRAWRVALLLCGSLLVAATGSVAGSSLPQDWPPIIQALEGEWVGEGALFETPAEFHMEWTAALNGQFMRLDFTNSMMRNGEMMEVLRAEAYYRPGPDGTLVANWFDTRGVAITIVAGVEEDRLVSTWTSPDETGRTTYRLLDADTVEVTDEVRAGEGYSQFGQARYTRVSR